MATPITSVFAVPSSPTMSGSSFDLLSSRSRSSTNSSQSFDLDLEDSDDEIVWSVSEGSLSSESGLDGERSISPASDDDFVVLSRPRSRRPSDSRIPTPTIADATAPNDLALGLARLSVNQVSATIRRNKKAAAAVAAAQLPDMGASSPKRRARKRITALSDTGGSSQSPSPTPPTPVSERPSSAATLRKGSPSGKVGRRRRKNKGGDILAGFGARPIVDDISEHLDSSSERDSEFAVSSMYEAATSYINSFLADPTSVGRLTLLQSLIIELGLASASLPASLTAAKAMLKANAFLHIADYLDARQRGPAAVQRVMHPSKTALIKDLRKKRNPASLQWVKESGLQVLLVTCYH
ncbi:hypothetical protein DFH07DRAFT_841009 [Mycena maculata]|uniref:Uncharacterized protein n=1 Tax=Mycena maculata TaxID=230809 RepID=A0AAD7MZ34_9AGAR|nr:hypothetical protein DFH07DRAFT_841009 [Mycena maculata]